MLTLTSGSLKSFHPEISSLITNDRLAEPGAGLKAGMGVPCRTELWVQNVCLSNFLSMPYVGCSHAVGLLLACMPLLSYLLT